jgi:polyhydroxybutyrate depolymerase
MRSQGVSATMRALLRASIAVALCGLLGACAAGVDPATLPGEGEADAGGSGGTASVEPSATGGAAGSSTTATAGSGTVVMGAGGGYETGAAGAGLGGVYGTGGVVGTGGFVAGGAGGTDDIGGLPNAVNAVCSPIVAGTSTVVANGVTRTFSVQMPADTSHMALLFLWHGWMQVPTDFANEIVYDVPAGKWVPFDPNAFPMPLMIVTPVDTKLIPPLGLDWDIVSGEKDFPFFEAMLHCIGEQFNIDETRIYSFGFSAGAVFTNLLSAKYPDLFAATISESGAWFNDQTQWSDVSIPLMQWQWPAFDAADGGNVLLTHGGPNDYATVISLESTNQKARPYLYSNGRTVIDCAHTFGHTLDPDLTQRMYYDYMWAHQLGGPPLSGMPPGFPTQASPVGATSCTFHPYP